MKRKILIFSVAMMFAVTGTAYSKGYLATDDLWIKAVINTVEGPIDAVFYNGGENFTERGDTVVWGYFYADPADVSWGHDGNPDLYVKIWFDVTGRIDVNFFHVSVPVIEVYTDYPYNGSYDRHGTATMDNRYVRHEYSAVPTTCENIGGNWSDFAVGNATFTIMGETRSSSFSGLRTVSVTQTDCSTEWNFSDSGMHYERTGTIKGNVVTLSGEMTNSVALADEIEDGLKEEGINASITFSTNTHSGEGTISGDKINYKGSGYMSGSFTYMGVPFDISVSLTENSTLTKTRNRSSADDLANSPIHSLADFLAETVREKFGD